MDHKKNQSSLIKTRFQIKFPNALFYAIVYVVFLGLVCPVSPLADDWYYVTSPNPDFQLSDLLPENTFWRPLDVLFGAFMGQFCGLFPALNRAFVVLAHVLNAVLLECILKRMEIKLQWRRFGVCFFLFSSAAWAVTLSPDALNQAYSVLFGLLAIYIHMKKGGYLYLLLCLIALFWKESGVSWFFVVPIFDAFLSGKTWNGFRKQPELVRRFSKQVAFSFLVVMAYFAARFSLLGSITLGNSSGTYKIDIFSFSTIKNAVLLFASAGTGVDSIALLSNKRSLLLSGITIICSLVFLFGWLVCMVRLLIKRVQLFPLFSIILCVIGLAAPLTILGSAGEMHAYPVLCGIAIIYSFCLDRADICVKKLCIPIICLFLAFSISSAHKLATIYDYSNRTKQLTQNIRMLYDDPTGSALFVVVGDWEGYSIFNQSAITGTNNGLSMRQYFDWMELDHTMYSAQSEDDCVAYIQMHQDQYTCIFVVRDESVQRVK